MKRSTFVFLLCILLLCVQVYSQDNPEDVVRVDTSLVVIPVRVIDSNGRFIPNLKKENFRVLEDKQEQEIVHFSTDDAPFIVAIMLDVSDSTKFKIKEIQDAAIAFLDQLRPNDHAIIFAFDKNVVKIYEGNAESLDRLRDSVRLTRTGGSTSLYDAVGVVVNDYLRISSERKKAIVLLTDGVDTTSRETNEKSLRAAQESDALIYSIQYDTVLDPRDINSKLPLGTTSTRATANGVPLSVAYKRGTTYLKFLSSRSGGRFYYADTLEKMTKAFSQIAGELSQQYSLSYYPPNQDADGKKRSIKVSADVKNAKLIHRKTYIFKSKAK